MKNTITVELNNSFKGVENKFQIELPLYFNPSYLEGLPVVVPRRLAEKNNINTYSYQFESMEADDVYVIAAEGLAAELVKDQPVLLAELIQWCASVTVSDQLDYLVENLLPDLKDDPKVKEAIQQAFELGKLDAQS